MQDTQAWVWAGPAQECTSRAERKAGSLGLSLGLGLGLGEPRAGPGDPRGSRREEEDGPGPGVQKRDEQAQGSGTWRPGPAGAQKLTQIAPAPRRLFPSLPIPTPLPEI